MTKPVRRIAITVTEEEYEILKQYSDLISEKPTSLVHKVLFDLYPSFIEVLQSVNKLKNEQAKLREYVQSGTIQAGSL